jgi:5-methylcytosine-specific restriction endonuclease McrBC regulatory subunit McrC
LATPQHNAGLACNNELHTARRTQRKSNKKKERHTEKDDVFIFVWLSHGRKTTKIAPQKTQLVFSHVSLLLFVLVLARRAAGHHFSALFRQEREVKCTGVAPDAK